MGTGEAHAAALPRGPWSTLQRREENATRFPRKPSYRSLPIRSAGAAIRRDLRSLQQDQFFAPRSTKASGRKHSVEGEPVISPPAEHAADRTQREHAEQTIVGAQLRWLEFDRVAARAFVPYPEQMRQPARPVLIRGIHLIPQPACVPGNLRCRAQDTHAKWPSREGQESGKRFSLVLYALLETAGPLASLEAEPGSFERGRFGDSSNNWPEPASGRTDSSPADAV